MDSDEERRIATGGQRLLTGRRERAQQAVATADCKPDSHDRHTHSMHHKPDWEWKSLEAGMYSPQREYDGLS